MEDADFPQYSEMPIQRRETFLVINYFKFKEHNPKLFSSEKKMEV